MLEKLKPYRLWEVWLRLCKTRSILDYRPVIFLEEVGPYVEVRSRGGRRAVAKATAGPCRGCLGKLPIFTTPTTAGREWKPRLSFT